MAAAGASWKETLSLLLHDSGGTGLSGHYTDRVFGRQKYVSWRSIMSLLTLYLGDKVNVFKSVTGSFVHLARPSCLAAIRTVCLGKLK